MCYFNRLHVCAACLLLCLGTFLWSCKDNDTERNGFSPVAASFTSCFDGASTRVKDTGFSSTDCVGIYMLAKDGAIGTADFAVYTPSGSLLEAEEDPLYYPIGGKEVSFIAFAPMPGSDWGAYTDGGNTVTYNLSKQTKPEHLEQMDFVYCDTGDTDYYSSASPNATLNFTHNLSKVIIKIFPAEGVEHDLSKLSATINELPTTVTCTLSDGSTKEGTTKSALALPMDHYNADSVMFAAIVAPHENANRKVTFKLNGTTLSTVPVINEEYEAGNSYTYNFILTQADMVVWKSTEITDWTGGAVAWNGQHVIRCSEPSLTFDVYKTSGTLLVSTDYPSTLSKPSFIGTPNNNWLTVKTWERAPELDTGKYQYYKLTYTAAGNTNSASRDGNIHLFADGLTLDIPVSQRAGNPIFKNVDMEQSNCYLVPTKSILYIPAGARVLEYNTKYCDGAPYDIYDSEMTADVLWSSVTAYNDVSSTGVVHPGSAVSGVEVLGKGENSVIRVTVGERDDGNVVVAFRDKSTGVIRWSFHIWVTYFDPNEVTYRPMYTTFMERNIGTVDDAYLDNGLLYQWGRKDPIIQYGSWWIKKPGTNEYILEAPEKSALWGGVSVSSSIASPSSFFKTYENWWRGDGSRNTWEDIHDPCPLGWKLPGGWDFGDFIYFLGNKDWNAAGLEMTCDTGVLGFYYSKGRDYDTGELFSTNYFSWTDNGNGNHAECYPREPGATWEVNPEVPKSTALPVRCVKR